MKRSKQTSKRKQVIVFIVCGCKKPSFQTDDIHTFWNGARCDFVKKDRPASFRRFDDQNELNQTREDLF